MADQWEVLLTRWTMLPMLHKRQIGVRNIDGILPCHRLYSQLAMLEPINAPTYDLKTDKDLQDIFRLLDKIQGAYIGDNGMRMTLNELLSKKGPDHKPSLLNLAIELVSLYPASDDVIGRIINKIVLVLEKRVEVLKKHLQ